MVQGHQISRLHVYGLHATGEFNTFNTNIYVTLLLSPSRDEGKCDIRSIFSILYLFDSILISVSCDPLSVLITYQGIITSVPRDGIHLEI